MFIYGEGYIKQENNLICYALDSFPDVYTENMQQPQRVRITFWLVVLMLYSHL